MIEETLAAHAGLEPALFRARTGRVASYTSGHYIRGRGGFGPPRAASTAALPIKLPDPEETLPLLIAGQGSRLHSTSRPALFVPPAPRSSDKESSTPLPASFTASQTLDRRIKLRLWTNRSETIRPAHCAVE